MLVLRDVNNNRFRLPVITAGLRLAVRVVALVIAVEHFDFVVRDLHFDLFFLFLAIRANRNFFVPLNLSFPLGSLSEKLDRVSVTAGKLDAVLHFLVPSSLNLVTIL